MEVKIPVPNTLRDIPLHKYQSLITKENPTDEDSIVCLLDIQRGHVKHIKQADYEFLVEASKKMFDVETPLIKNFTLNGITYGFIPNLDEITYGENKDITKYLSEWGNMHKAMAVLYRPITKKIGEKYLIEPYEGSHFYSDQLKEMPLDIALGASVFFYRLIRDLLSCIQSYLEKNKQELEKNRDSQTNYQTSETDLQSAGEAMQSYILLLKEILQSLKR
tara:strand:+ start:1517 stop:2176 length:660 start_codon:yes stop_codon:yes gene_type:complete